MVIITVVDLITIAASCRAKGGGCFRVVPTPWKEFLPWSMQNSQRVLMSVRGPRAKGPGRVILLTKGLRQGAKK